MIKEGDKVICINDESYAINSGNDSESFLTKNKQYRVTGIGHNHIVVINNADKRTAYNLDRFISIAEWREQQIKSVLDD